MQSPWRIELLGWLQAEMDDHTVTRFATRKTAALLARLALWPRRAHSREELIDLLWPEADFDAARARLRQALTSLRHQLEPPGVEVGSVLITDRTHVRLNPAAISTDVADFEAAVRSGHLTEAIALYKGELLPGYYEEWILAERERLQARFEEVVQAEATNRPRTPGEPTSSEHASTDRETLDAASRIRLPLQFTRFFGRTNEQARIGKMLAEHRLVTLTGTGGVGKTRLAIEAARQLPGQVIFVSLADVVDGQRIAEAVAEVLRLSREDTRPTIEQLVEALLSNPTLLVLDNVEHLVAYAAPLVLALLSRLASLRLLVTSRRRLHIAGEREFSVPALPTPTVGSTPEQMASIAAVQLFVDRAQTVRPDFQLTPRNAADVALLCRQLEGSPLALELAAARASTLTPAQMLARLAQRFELLATRRTDKDARHRSLWATIAWSVDLLPDTLQRFWRYLSVFRGGFTGESAAAITQESAALEALTQLRERSLVSLDDRENEMRFRMAESLREFAQEQMDAEGQRESEERHGAYFLQLAQESEEALRGPAQVAWLERLEEEHDNLRVALANGIQRRDAEFSQRLAGALWGFWERHGHLKEGQEWLERTLALPGPTASTVRARALNRLGAVLNASGALDRAAEVHRETLALYEQLEDKKGIALAWNRLGFVAGQRGQNDEARRAFSEALARERELDNRFNMTVALVNLGIIAQAQGRYDEAEQAYTEGLTLFQEMDNPSGIADTLLNLASISVDQGKWEEAMPLLEQAAARYDALGDRWSRSYVTYTYAVVARYQERWEDAARLAGETLSVCQEVGDQSKVADALLQLGIIAQHHGENRQALERLENALEIYQRLGQNGAGAFCLREQALVSAAQGQFAQAARLLGISEKRREQAGRVLSPFEQQRYDKILAAIRPALSENAFQESWNEGYSQGEL